MALGRIYATSGKTDEARKIIDEPNRPEYRTEVDGYDLAVVHAALGELDQAFLYLEREYATGAWCLNFLKIDPDLDPLRADPRFKEMLKRVNLAQ